MEDDATTGVNLSYRPDTALGTVRHAPGRAILEYETGSVTSRQSLDIVRNRQVLDLDPGSKPTTIDAEACSNPRTDYKVGHHPVGRKSSGSALSVTADRPSLSRDRQLPGRPLTR